MLNLATASFKYDNLLNRSSSLNEYKLGWWLGLPPLSGGKYFYDILELSNGTLNAFNDANYGWKGSTKPGGFVSLRFDGNGNYISVSDQTKFKFGTENFTVSCWFMLETLNNSNSNGNQTIVSRYESGIDRGFDLSVNTLGQLTFKVAESSSTYGNYSTASSTIDSNIWYHCLAVRQGVNSYLYVNGALKASGTGVSTFNVSSGSQDLLFGDLVTNGGSHQYLQGYIDDICLYNTALPTQMAQRVFNESRTEYPTTLNKISINRTFPLRAPWIYYNSLQNAYGVSL